MHAIRGRRPLRAAYGERAERTRRTRAYCSPRRTISQGWRSTARRNVNDCTCREKDSPRGDVRRWEWNQERERENVERLERKREGQLGEREGGT